MPLLPSSLRRSPLLVLAITAFIALTLVVTNSNATDGFTFFSVLLFDDGYPKSSSEYASYVPSISRLHSNASLTPAERELQTRLRALLDAPLLDYQTALKRNEARDACPKAPADRQAIRDQLRMHSKYWTTIRAGELARKRMGIVRYLEGIVANGGDVLGRPGGGRGIVMTGGNKDTTARLLVTLRILRFEHRCTLPVELFTFPGEIDDQHVLMQLKALGTTVRELAGHKKLRKWKNFQIKADAIIASSFEEVLYLDSDNIPLRDPTFLFDDPLYRGSDRPGVVFWPDITKDHPTNPVWRLMGKTCYFDDWELETGQIVISKTGNRGLNLAALHIAAHMQAEHPFYFKLSDGDKDTFRYGFWALGATSEVEAAKIDGKKEKGLMYSTAPHWISTLGFHDDWEQGRFCGIAMVQHDLSPLSTDRLAASAPTPLFVHANLLKHREKSNKIPSPISSPSSPLSVGSPFTIIKRPIDLDAHAHSLMTGAARYYVYGNYGPCLDVGVRLDILASELKSPSSSFYAPAGGVNGSASLSREDQKAMDQHTIEERFADVAGGRFGEFDRMYRAQGGTDGGWEKSKDKL